jgi:hypothetical protein
MHTYGSLKRKLTANQELQVLEKKRAIMCFGFIHYKDAFGRIQTTEFTHYHWGPELSAAEAKRSRRGNTAT